MLLPSGPDTVHESPLRGTRSSSSRTSSALENADLGGEFGPARADCRYRAPLVPRLARLRKDNPDGPIDAGSEGVAPRPGAQIVTEQDPSTYTLVYNNDKVSAIKITNPDKFWGKSKYLVIVTNESSNGEVAASR